MGRVPKRIRNRKGEGERLRAELLDAASRLLAESGDAARVSVRAVAAAVGVTSPSVYRHFPSKEDLVREVLRLRFAEFRAALDGAAGRGDGTADRLARACRAYVDFGLANPGHYRLLFSTAGLGPAGAGLGEGEPHPGAASLAALVELAAERAGRHERTAALALELWASLHGVVDLRITKPEVDWPDVDAMIAPALRAVEDAAEEA